MNKWKTNYIRNAKDVNNTTKITQRHKTQLNESDFLKKTYTTHYEKILYSMLHISSKFQIDKKHENKKFCNYFQFLSRLKDM